jgi:hypothetical protein
MWMYRNVYEKDLIHEKDRCHRVKKRMPLRISNEDVTHVRDEGGKNEMRIKKW